VVFDELRSAVLPCAPGSGADLDSGHEVAEGYSDGSGSDQEGAQRRIAWHTAFQPSPRGDIPSGTSRGLGLRQVKVFASRAECDTELRPGSHHVIRVIHSFSIGATPIVARWSEGADGASRSARHRWVELRFKA
jgi:hypothetical protein